MEMGNLVQGSNTELGIKKYVKLSRFSIPTSLAQDILDPGTESSLILFLDFLLIPIPALLQSLGLCGYTFKYFLAYSGFTGPDVVVHACNLNYLEGEGRMTMV
jgi:hypothetical protein